MKDHVKITLAKSLKAKPGPNQKLGFGEIFTDHMFCMDHAPEQGWHDARIVPHEPIRISPAAKVFHYGQAAFEGLKAYRTKQGQVQLFRPRLNFERFNRTLARMVMPQIDEDEALQALKKLLQIEKDWVPEAPGTSLYIRPCVIATDPVLGIHASARYLFMILLSPSDPYYAQGLRPIDIFVETDQVRAVRGGTGQAKAAGNYAASFCAQVQAQGQGFQQVLWLDGIERRYLEEVGLMNVFFCIDKQLVTPPLSGSILPGITRRSVIELAEKSGIEVCQRPISIEEITRKIESGQISEAFGTGTAAIIAPIGSLAHRQRRYEIGNGKAGPLSQKLHETLTGLQCGRLPDEDGWTEPI